MGTARLATYRETEPNTSVGLQPAWAVAAESRVQAAHHRTYSGRLYTYRWGVYGAWRVPLRFVPDDVRAALHGWWRGQEPLLFTLDDSAARSHALCRIVNDAEPLGRQARPFADRWAGVLELEAIDGRLRLGLPFILDHPADGRLDQPHLSLL